MTAALVSIGEASGWEATVIVTDVNGLVRARASSMCLNDEENWRSRARYEWHYDLKDGTTSAEEPEDKGLIQWEPNPNKPGRSRPKRKRVHVGDEPMPLFQLRSMATTRAQSKALAMILRFVPVLAGLRTTPSEELPHAERVPQGLVVEAEPTPGTGGLITGGTGDPAPAPAKPAPKATNGGGARKLSEKLVGWLEREMSKHKVAPADVLAYLADVGLPGVRAWSDVPMSHMDGLIAFVRGDHAGREVGEEG